MPEAILHYVHDPLCGWCYAAAPLVKAARALVAVEAHAGGMMAGSRRRPVTAQLREFVASHDREIARQSGQPFGSAYFDGLLRDTSAVFDSEPPIAAVLAAESVAGRGLDLLSSLQVAHYVEGRRIADRTALVEIAQSIGVDAEAFAVAFDAMLAGGAKEHISRTRSLMARLGAQGFPSLYLETEGRMEALDIGAFLGNPEGFSAWLRGRLGTAASAGSAVSTSDRCGPDGCLL